MNDEIKLTEEMKKTLVDALVKDIMEAQPMMGVSPMTGPTDLVFAMRSRYNTAERSVELELERWIDPDKEKELRRFLVSPPVPLWERD